MTTSKYAGDAVLSYAAIKQASTVFSGECTILSLMSLFAVLEAAVLYEHLLYLPLGDKKSESAGRFEIWAALSKQQLLSPIDDAYLNSQTRVISRAKEAWKRQILSNRYIPSYSHISKSELIDNTFEHSLGAIAYAYDYSIEDSNEVLTAEGLSRWVNHVTGIGYDQAEQDANDGKDDGLFMNWEYTAMSVARASVVREMGSNFIGDAIEGPVIQVSEARSRRDSAATLYAKLSGAFSIKISALINDGYTASLPIPPIVALILDRSDGTINSLVSETAALRLEFSTFRSKYRQYSELLQSPTGKTIGELIAARRDAIEEVEGALNKLKGERTDSRLLSELMGASLKPSSENDATLSIEPSISLNALAKMGIERIALSRIKGRAQILFDVYSKAMQIKNYHSLIGRRLGVQITNDDFNSYTAYARAVDELSGIART